MPERGWPQDGLPREQGPRINDKGHSKRIGLIMAAGLTSIVRIISATQIRGNSNKMGVMAHDAPRAARGWVSGVSTENLRNETKSIAMSGDLILTPTHDP